MAPFYYIRTLVALQTLPVLSMDDYWMFYFSVLSIDEYWMFYLNIFLYFFVQASWWTRCCLCTNFIWCTGIYFEYERLDDPIFVFAQTEFYVQAPPWPHFCLCSNLICAMTLRLSSYGLSYCNECFDNSLFTEQINSIWMLKTAWLWYSSPIRPWVTLFVVCCVMGLYLLSQIYHYFRIQRKEWAYGSFFSYVYHTPSRLYKYSLTSLYSRFKAVMFIITGSFLWPHFFWLRQTKYVHLNAHMCVHHLYYLHAHMCVRHTHLHYLPYTQQL